MCVCVKNKNKLLNHELLPASVDLPFRFVCVCVWNVCVSVCLYVCVTCVRMYVYV